MSSIVTEPVNAAGSAGAVQTIALPPVAQGW
jgi:hypothetical protein